MARLSPKALPPIALGASLIAIGLVMLLVSYVPMAERAALLLGVAGQALPVIGVASMQRSADRMGAAHRANLTLAFAFGFCAMVVARMVLRGLVTRHTLSPDALADMSSQFLADAFLALSVVFALWIPSGVPTRSLLVVGAATVVASHFPLMASPRLPDGSVGFDALVLAAFWLLVAGYLVLAVAAALFAKRFSKIPDAPQEIPAAA